MPHTKITQENAGRIVSIKVVGLDDFSHVRHIHTQAVRIFGAPFHSDEEVNARLQMIRQPEYAGDLLRQNLHAAWSGDQMVGTAGWQICRKDAGVACIAAVNVHPLFAGMGLGSVLVADAEMRAAMEGYKNFAAEANYNAMGFFEKLGYEKQAYGRLKTPCGLFLPLGLMHKQTGRKMIDRSSEEKLRPVNELEHAAAATA